MYTRVTVGSIFTTFVISGAALNAQSIDVPPPAGGSPPASQPAVQTDMQHMQHGTGMFMLPARDGSGTSWLPDDSPMYAVHTALGAWTLMGHGNAFLQYLNDGGDRGARQIGSINWLMGSADRLIGGGHVGVHAMVSLEPATINGCGYPDLLASGEMCRGAAIHDRQHPHDVFMELAATYDHRLTGDLRWQVYGGPVGEPALGPTAFPHRVSAMPNPVAPITHHWFDATHITYGVITGAVYGGRWKAESSLFNGREPDEHRWNIEHGAFDSFSARLGLLPTGRWALQASAAHLSEAEAGHDGAPRADVDRTTASVTYHRRLGQGSLWASTLGWGRNDGPDTAATHALLAETSLALANGATWFGRVEWSEKSGHDLAIESDETFTVAKVAGGYTRYFRPWTGLQPGIGGAVSAAAVPDALTRVYGRRVNVGAAVFVTLRPAATGM